MHQTEVKGTQQSNSTGLGVVGLILPRRGRGAFGVPWNPGFGARVNVICPLKLRRLRRERS